MFTENSIRDLRPGDGAPFTRALVDKLVDIDKNRIHSTDDLVVRKAVFGMLEIVAQLESRIAALESPDTRSGWNDRAVSGRAAPTPDEIRLGERS